MSTRGRVLNGGYGTKYSSGSMSGVSLGFVVRPVEKADTGASSKTFEITDFNEECCLGVDSGALEGGRPLSHEH